MKQSRLIDFRGVTRLVFVFKSIVIKIPRLNFGHTNFLYGCLSNWKERQFYKKFKDVPGFGELIVPTVWCSWFGLIQIQRRAYVLDRNLTQEEIEKFNKVCTDSQGANFGIYNGNLVCIDYGE